MEKMKIKKIKQIESQDAPATNLGGVRSRCYTLSHNTTTSLPNCYMCCDYTYHDGVAWVCCNYG